MNSIVEIEKMLYKISDIANVRASAKKVGETIEITIHAEFVIRAKKQTKKTERYNNAFRETIQN